MNISTRERESALNSFPRTQPIKDFPQQVLNVACKYLLTNRTRNELCRESGPPPQDASLKGKAEPGTRIWSPLWSAPVPLYPETQTILLIFHSTIRIKVQYGIHWVQRCSPTQTILPFLLCTITSIWESSPIRWQKTNQPIYNSFLKEVLWFGVWRMIP